MALGLLFTAFLCLVFDVEWDSEAGIGITSGAMLMSAPFVSYALQFADLYAVPVLTALCASCLTEMFCTLLEISDEYFIKTLLMSIAFVVAFYFASNV